MVVSATLYKGLRACDLMPFLYRDFALIFAIFTKVCRVFFCYFCRNFLLSLSMPALRVFDRLYYHHHSVHETAVTLGNRYLP